MKKIGMGILKLAILQRILTWVFGEGWRSLLLSRTGSAALFVMPGDTVVLAGCRKIETVRRYADIAGVNGTVVAIEANEESAEKLREDVSRDPQLQSASNIVLVNKGVWDCKTKLTFLASTDDEHGYDKIEHESLEEFEFETVGGIEHQSISVDTIDNILSENGIGQVNYIVITINNAELQALDGLKHTIEASPKVRIYIHTISPYPFDQVKDKLHRLGYKLSARPVNPGSRLYRVYAYGRKKV